MKKNKKEKKPSKFKLWKQKMKSTPKGKSILKLIYWSIFFLALFIFLGVSSIITSNHENLSNTDNTINKVEDDEEVIIPKTLDNMMNELMNGTYEYTYDIHILENEFLFEGTKYDTYEEGYKNYVTNLGSGVIKYYIDSTGTYQVNGQEKALITNFYDGINTQFLNLEELFSIMNALGLKKDENITSYTSYYCSDNDYQYMLNINQNGTFITDISIVSMDGNTTYLLSFNNVGDVSHE